MNARDTLKVSMPTDRELVLERVFDAPSRLVFAAWTEPELLRRWYGRSGWELVVCDIDLRVGGRWRFVTRDTNGKEVGQYGVYLEVMPDERLVNTESWEDWNPGEVHVTTTFVESAGRTTLTSTLLFPTQEVRDTLQKFGMTSGVADAYDQLERLLAALG